MHAMATPRVIRLALVMLVALVVGAIINVGVAWSLSLLIDPFSTTFDDPGTRWGQRLSEQGRQWNATSFSRRGALRLSAHTGPVREGDKDQSEDPAELLPRWWRAGRFIDAPSEEIWAKLAENAVWQLSLDEMIQFQSHAEARGWPLVSMWYEPHHTDRPSSPGLMDVAGGIEVPLDPWIDPIPFGGVDQPRTLPLRVIWSRFAINTILYAALVWAAVVMPSALRRRLRRRRGLCPACGYNLRGHTETSEMVCPECGVNCGRTGRR